MEGSPAAGTAGIASAAVGMEAGCRSNRRRVEGRRALGRPWVAEGCRSRLEVVVSRSRRRRLAVGIPGAEGRRVLCRPL